MTIISKNKEFKLLEKIGRGRFSCVYRGEYQCKVVAIKEVDKDDERPPHNSAIELQLLRFVKNDYICQLLDDFECTNRDGDICRYFIMPLYQCDLKTLCHQYLKAGFPVNGTVSWKNTMPIAKAMQLTLGIAEGLDYLHQQGIIHRDIKPENIMFADPQGQPILIDFGIAWPKDCNGVKGEEPKHTDVGSGIYRAPELLFGIQDYSHKIDIWSLGIVVTELLSASGVSIVEKELGEYPTDIGLIATLYKIFGAPSESSWPEVAHSESFQNFSVEQSRALDWRTILPRAKDYEYLYKILQPMLQFSACNRIEASEIVLQISGAGQALNNINRI